MSLPTGPILPSADVLNSYEHGKFVLSNLAAKRAKQLKEGAPPLVRIESNHPLTIALAEIAAGKINAILGSEDMEHAIIDTEVKIISDEPVPGELGILLPALDETEADLVGIATLVADEHELDHEEELEAGPSLTDLLDNTEAEVEAEVEADVVEADEETLSLTDIAEQETSEEEEETAD